MPSYLGGISEGLWAGVEQQRAENQRLDEQRRELERGVFGSLINSANPKLQAMAVAGMLDAASPKRRMKGLAGFLDEYEKNPQIGEIQRYLSTPERTKVASGLPSRSMTPTVGGGPAPLPSPGGAALPSTSPVTGGPIAGSPPPSAPMFGGPPPAPTAADLGALPAGTHANPEVRSIAQTAAPLPSVMSPEAQQVTGKTPFPVEHSGASADVYEMQTPSLGLSPQEREVAGLAQALGGTPDAWERAKYLVQQKYLKAYGRGSLNPTKVNVEVPDGQGGFRQVAAFFDPGIRRYVDPDTQQPLEGARPVSHTGSSSMGALFERAAQIAGYPERRRRPARSGESAGQ